MSDFFQNGTITTLHNLGNRPIAEIEYELDLFARVRNINLVLPCLYAELQGPALENIVNELKDATYLNRIIIGLDRGDEAQFEHARAYFSILPQDHRILWNDGPRLSSLRQELVDIGLELGEPGKGRNVWGCYGYALATGQDSDAIALHDCDIVTFDRGLLARLVYPVANPGFRYQFCKGYYSRIGNARLNGRVARLLVTPLIRALKQIYAPDAYLDYLDSFRYPLAGEMSLRQSVLPNLRIPSDWGLEIGILSEMYRNKALTDICQVDIAETYDHKHQQLSAEDESTGLHRMAVEICKAIFRKMGTMGHGFSEAHIRAIKATYYRAALEFIDQYYDDAMINGLNLDRHEEEKAAELFSVAIVKAGEQFRERPLETPFIPSWNRVTSAVPEFLQRYREAVEADNA